MTGRDRFLIAPGCAGSPGMAADRRAARNDESVGPVGAEAAWGVLIFDCGEDVAAEEEGEAPVEGTGVGSGESIGYTDGEVTSQGVGVAYSEIERAAGSICALIGGGKGLRGSRAVPESEAGARGNSDGGRVQEIDSVRTAVEEAGVSEGGVVESGGEISRGRINGIDRRAA